MKYFRLDLLTLLISLFIFNSCQDADTIGLDINRGTQVSGTATDTITVNTNTVTEDSLITVNLPQQPVGYLNDPVFGSTETNLALALSFPSDSLSISFGNNPTLDSAVLVLKYGSEFYRDTTTVTNYTVNVFQLNEKYNVNTSYFNTKSWKLSPTLIGDTTLSRFAINDSLRIKIPRPGKADTTIKVSSQLRIPIDKDFIISQFFNAPSSGFNKTKFTEYIKGLYVTVNKEKLTGSGGVVFFDPEASGLALYYKRNSGGKIDTNIINFPLVSSASHIKHTHPQAIKDQLTNSPTNPNTVFAEALGGLRTRVQFPYLNELKKLGKITINKAELIVYKDESILIPFAPAPRLTFYTTDIAGQRQEVPDNDIGQLNGRGDIRALDATTFGGFYDKTNKRYIFTITAYIQSILSGKVTQYYSYIAPIKADLVRTAARSTQNLDSRIIDLFPSGTTAARVALGGGTKSNSVYKMKLNIIYTRLAD